MKINSPDLMHLVLLGGGHAQISVLKSLGMRPIDGLRITLISRDRLTPYSGMLPGYIEGRYTKTESMIDLVRLAHFAGARFIHDALTGIDPDRKRLILGYHPPIHYDWLSVNIGSTPRLDHIHGANIHALPIKPVPELIEHLDAVTTGKAPCSHINIIGGGVAGVEVAFALHHRLNMMAQQQVNITVIHSGQRLVEHMNISASRLINKTMQAYGITAITGRKAISVTDQQIILDDASSLATDLTLITTGATPPSWLSDTGISTCPAGFIAVNRHCQSISYPDIFAAGDIATLIDDTRPKSGVFAVRAGAILTTNIRHSLTRKPLRKWYPQRHYLALIGIGGGSAMAIRGQLAFKARPVLWRLKEWIDRRFISRFSDLPDMPAPPQPELAKYVNHTDDPVFLTMQCMGCGGKAGWSTLSQAINQAYHMAQQMRPDLRFSTPDGDINQDAGQIAIPQGNKGYDLFQSVDAISAITDDPYMLGRIATLHALSDLFAAHATPFSALGLISLPRAGRSQQSDDLLHILTAMLIALAEHGIGLNGGHTVTADAMQIGMAVNGLRKSDLVERPPIIGDVLILTKPLGIGMIMAGYHKNHPAVSGVMVKSAINIMATSNAAAAAIATEYGIFPMTDVTGFGLMRHARSLADRFDPQMGLSISLKHLPYLAGIDNLLDAGIASSMMADNIAATYVINGTTSHLPLALLHDPQTSGGLLMLAPSDIAAKLCGKLKATGHHAAIIGHINDARDGAITVTD
jgi:selenide,water dikinase